MRTVQPMSQYAAPPGLQRGPRTNSLSSREGEAQMGFQHEPRAESRSSREGEYEVRPQSSGKQRAQDKKPGNDGELKFLQAQLESLGIDSSFTGFLEDPIAHYVVSKLVDIATSERREKEQLIEEREHLARSKQEMESQLTTALVKRQISPPMGEIGERRAKKSREATPRREILPLPQSRPRSQPPRQHQQPTAGPSMTRVTSSHSDTTPRRELPLPYNEVSALRGMGPKAQHKYEYPASTCKLTRGNTRPNTRGSESSILTLQSGPGPNNYSRVRIRIYPRIDPCYALMGPKVPNARRNTATNPPRIEVHCTVPHSYPRGEQKLIQDPTPEEDQTTEENPLEESQPGESTDEETSEEEELERLSTPEKETPNQKRLRDQKNTTREAKRARLAEETAQKRARHRNS
ncbi:hypothetical protein BD779DRAFT_1471285 [Infundibulicybe gibba]|nr:hypothetical protein BD779DRAFT_1471285 [Infundibulicybe gibba]